MKSSKDYRYEDLLKETESLIKELSNTKAMFNSTNREDDEELLEGRVNDVLAKLGTGYQIKVDAKIELSLVDNNIRCLAALHPPNNLGKPLDFDAAVNFLREEGVLFGINEGVLRESIRRCNYELKTIDAVPVAEGRQAQTEIAEHYVVEQRFQKLLSNEVTEKRNILLVVRKEEVIATKHPGKQGITGKTVLGEDVEFSIQKKPEYSFGENIKIDAAEVVSAIDGLLKYENQTFYVEETLVLKAGVNRKTGNINFPGNIYVSGEVMPGFLISTNKSLIVKETLDASRIRCGENLQVNNGIIGRQKAEVLVEGTVQAKFIENSMVVAKKGLRIDVCIMNSAIKTNGKISMGEKGVILGGSVFAQQGIETFQLGSKNNSRTEIVCGIDYLVFEKLEYIRDKNIQLAEKLSHIDFFIGKKQEGVEKLQVLRQRLRDKIRTLNERMLQLVNRLDMNEDAEIIVKGSVYPGVYVEICHISWIVTETLTNVKFKLNKQKGRVDTIKLT